jgi:hypothetical protein
MLVLIYIHTHIMNLCNYEIKAMLKVGRAALLVEFWFFCLAGWVLVLAGRNADKARNI